MAIGAQEMQVRQQELALKVQELELKQRELQASLPPRNSRPCNKRRALKCSRRRRARPTRGNSGAMTTYVMRNGALVDKRSAPPRASAARRM